MQRQFFARRTPGGSSNVPVEVQLGEQPCDARGNGRTTNEAALGNAHTRPGQPKKVDGQPRASGTDDEITPVADAHGNPGVSSPQAYSVVEVEITPLSSIATGEEQVQWSAARESQSHSAL